MRNILILLFSATFLVFSHKVWAGDTGRIDLSGEWAFRLDPEDMGLMEQWFEQELPDKVQLPGSLDEQGIGVPRSEIYMGRLTSETRYVGAAWYQKEIVIPDNWRDHRIALSLERACWETRLYVDGLYIGTRNSLSVPHIYDLSGLLPPGRHILTLRVDNTVKINIGHTLGNMLWTHAVTEQTQTNWNGIIGNIMLMASPRVWIEDIKTYPDFSSRTSRIRVRIGNSLGNSAEVGLGFSYLPDGGSVKGVSFTLHGQDTLIETEVPFGASPRYWDEFSPELNILEATLRAGKYSDRRSVQFGLREFKASGQHFELNGPRIYLRGKVCSAVFPLTGYPPMTVAEWHRLFSIYGNYGLNHVRFHSWCPPEAAFEAADNLGMILQIEPPLWDGYGMVGSIPERATFILTEANRIVDTYGNHPSFCLMSMGNELGTGNEPYLAYLVDYMKEKDPRHLYTSTTHPPGTGRDDDYFVGAGTEQGVCRGIRPFGDYRIELDSLKRPLIAHELGQPAMYPNYLEIPKYSGHLKPLYLDAFKESLSNHGMLDQAEDFRKASGALLVEIYKENIEAQLRTPNVAGFQMLDLQDYPGHGMAVIGILDVFLESKGLITSEQFRRFCSPTVPLIRMKGFTWTSDEVFMATAEIAHYGKSDLKDQKAEWTIRNQAGDVLYSSSTEEMDIPTGISTQLGEIKMNLAMIKVPQQLEIELSLPGTEIANSWKIWVYPAETDTAFPDDITVSRKWDEATREILVNGGKVLVIPEQETLENIEEVRWLPVFWSYQLFKQPKTMGMVCNPTHLVLAGFPTDIFGDWQWRGLLDNSEALIIDGTPPQFRPIIEFVPDFNSNHKLSAILEAKVGQGRLIVCNINLLDPENTDPAAKQLLSSLLSYMQSEDFLPIHSLDIATVDRILESRPKLKNRSDKPATDNAVLNVRAAVTATVGVTDAWDCENNSDEIIAMQSGYNYSIEEKNWRDASSASAWFAKHLVIRVSCPRDFRGSFYVFFHDSNSQERAAALFFSGKDHGPLPRYDKKGVWLKFPVTDEMASTGELVLDASVTRGPNVTISQIILIPE